MKLSATLNDIKHKVVADTIKSNAIEGAMILIARDHTVLFAKDNKLIGNTEIAKQLEHNGKLINEITRANIINEFEIDEFIESVESIRKAQEIFAKWKNNWGVI